MRHKTPDPPPAPWRPPSHRTGVSATCRKFIKSLCGLELALTESVCRPAGRWSLPAGSDLKWPQPPVSSTWSVRVRRRGRHRRPAPGRSPRRRRRCRRRRSRRLPPRNRPPRGTRRTRSRNRRQSPRRPGTAGPGRLRRQAPAVDGGVPRRQADHAVGGGAQGGRVVEPAVGVPLAQDDAGAADGGHVDGIEGDWCSSWTDGKQAGAAGGVLPGSPPRRRRWSASSTAACRRGSRSTPSRRTFTSMRCLSLFRTEKSTDRGVAVIGPLAVDLAQHGAAVGVGADGEVARPGADRAQPAGRRRCR